MKVGKHKRIALDMEHNRSTKNLLHNHGGDKNPSIRVIELEETRSLVAGSHSSTLKTPLSACGA